LNFKCCMTASRALVADQEPQIQVFCNEIHAA
jgi:hypothetical protein